MATRRDQHDPGALDELIEEILVDAYGDDEQLGAFLEAFSDRLTLPEDAFVIGEPVSVVEVDYDGNPLRSLTAKCRREGTGEHVIGLSDVRFPEGSEGARLLAAYRKWLGIEPDPSPTTSRPAKRHKAAEDDLDLSGPIELIALAVKSGTARCRIPDLDREITLRSRDVWNVVPGEMMTVRPRKQWRYGGHPYLSGDVESSRLDVPALGLTPLGLEDMGTWDPAEEYWGEVGEPLEEWVKPIVARGPRAEFRMEQVLPGQDPEDPLMDPILEASELQAAGDPVEAEKILMDMLTVDLRCVDAHAHLGNFAFDHRPEVALRHHEVGMRIGELSLDADFGGVLRWGWIDNRPFLRCLHGYGLCLWRLGRSQEAAAVFERMLWLSPSDNQGVRFLIGPARSGESWDEGSGET